MEQPDPSTVQRNVGDEIFRIHREAHGSGAKAAWAHIHEDEVIVTIDEIEFLPVEAFMIERGKSDEVLQMRTQYQLAIKDVFSAAVERATGRRVVGFSSMTNLDPPYAVEYFRLDQPPDLDLPEDPEGT
jgi:uncharacterized protein YbcI